MTRSECALSPNCCLSAENKRDRKASRLIDCRLCLKSWHAFCIGYETLEEAELDEKSTKFVCNKCNFFVNAVADVVSDKISVLLDNLQTKLEEKLSMRTNVDLRNEEINNVCDLTQSVTVDVAPPTSVVQPTAKNCSSTNTIEDETKTKKGANDQDHGFNDSNEMNGKLFLCSIEKELSVNDVCLILEDAGIELKEISLKENEGNFKHKKYLTIEATEKVKLFRFKLSFNQSKLNGTWFLRSTPPRNPTKHHFNNSSRREPTQSAHLNKYTSEPSIIPPSSDNRQNFRTAPFNKNIASKNHPNLNYSEDTYSKKRPLTYVEALNKNNRQNHVIQTPPSDNEYISKGDFQTFLGHVLEQILQR